MASVVESLEAELAGKSACDIERGDSEEAALSANALKQERERTPRAAKRSKRDHAYQQTSQTPQRRPNVWSLSRSNRTSSGDTHISRVCCHSTITGSPRVELAWRVDLGKCIDASPLVIRREQHAHERSAETRSTWVVIGSHSAELACVDAENHGEVVWKRTLDGRIEATASFSERSLTVYVGTYSGALYAIDLATGDDKWVFRAPDAIKAAVRVIDELQLVVCGAYDHTVYAIDSVSGKKRWELSANGGSVFSAPAYLAATRQLFIASTKGYVCCVVLSDPHCRVPTLRWDRHLPAPVFSSLEVSPTTHLLFVGCANGVMYALDTDSGDVRWQHATEKPVFSSPCVYDHARDVSDDTKGESECVLFGSHDGVLRKVSSRSGDLIWATQLGSPIFGSPAVFDLIPAAAFKSGSERARRRMCCVATVNGTLFLCDEATGEIAAQVISVVQRAAGGGSSASSGSEADRAQHHQPLALGELFSSPVVIDDLCLIGSRSNQLFAFGLL